MLRLLVAACLLLLAQSVTFAQSQFLPLGGYSYDLVDRMDILYGKLLLWELHTSVKPFGRKRVADVTDTLLHNHLLLDKRTNADLKYLIDENSEWIADTISKSKQPILKYFYQEPATFFKVDIKNFNLKINPGWQFSFGREIEGTKFQFINTRYLEIRGSIMKKLSFYTSLAENQYRGMAYVQDKINHDHAVNGQGYYKPIYGDAVDYFDARGGIVFNVLGHVDIQLAHDKNFIGNGYRSFFLSDNSSSYFFLKLQTTIWRFTYTNLFTEMIATYNRGVDQNLPRKYVAFHHLNLHATKWLEIGLFEAVDYHRNNGFEIQYLNPIIFYKAIQNQLGSPDKSEVGIDYKLNFLEHLQWYGQVLFDEFNVKNLIQHNGWWANKFAIQTGLKYVDAFTVPHLDLQAEFNVARPYTFTAKDSATTYTNYNQAIGHPLGANFWELVVIGKYQILPGLHFIGKLIYYEKGLDSGGITYGGNIFRPYFLPNNGSLDVLGNYNNKIGQGASNKVLLLDLMVSYQIKHNFYLDFNFVFRHSSAAIEEFKNTGLYFGLGTRLNLPYHGHDY